MGKTLSAILGIGGLFFASFSSSSSYNLNSYSVGPGGTNNAASSTYKTQSNVGEISNSGTSSTTYNSHNGAVQTEQLNLPQAPTVSNGSGTYYNKLLVTLNTGILPSDTTYAIAASTNGFTSTSYVQADGTLNSTPVYQTYSTWGGSSGVFMIGLTPSTTYEVKVAAKQGLFTNTEYGPFATTATVGPSITFAVSPSTDNIGTLLAGSVITAPTNITLSLTTNAASGANIFVAGQNGGLHSNKDSYTISAVTANLASSSEGFGLQDVSATQTSGGPLTIKSPFNGSSNNVGTETTTLAPIFTTSAAISGGSGVVDLQAKAQATDPASTDYQEVLTFVASASF